jgi:hypothetical protein
VTVDPFGQGELTDTPFWNEYHGCGAMAYFLTDRQMADLYGKSDQSIVMDSFRLKRPDSVNLVADPSLWSVGADRAGATMSLVTAESGLAVAVAADGGAEGYTLLCRFRLTQRVRWSRCCPRRPSIVR